MSRQPLPWTLVAPLAALPFAVYAAATFWVGDAAMSDEYYYLDCAQRLAWGYVDHPPLSIAVLKLVVAALGDSLAALRLVPAALHAGTIVLTAAIARELGGGRTAQALAALAALASPAYQAVAGFYSMNAFEPALWAAAVLLLARLVNGGDARLWLLLGLVLGLGLLNKLSMLWLGAGIGVGLVLTRERRWLATPWPWAAAALALAIFAPHIVWQVQNGFPTREFVHNATTLKMVVKTPLAILSEQLLAMNPLAVPLWLAGLAWYFASKDGRRQQLLAWAWLVPLAILLVQRTVRPNYLGPAYPALLAAGGVVVERAAARWRALPALTGAAVALGGLGSLPFARPLLAPEEFAAYSRALHIEVPRDQVEDTGELPIHFALRHGWPEYLAAVESAAATLSPDERERAGVLAPWFGGAGAIGFARRHGRDLPPAVSGHNNYWLWGPGALDGSVMLVPSPSAEPLQKVWDDVRPAAEVHCRWCMPDMSRLVVFVCRRPKHALAEIWPAFKHYQ